MNINEFRKKSLLLIAARDYMKLNLKLREELKKQCTSKQFADITTNVALIEHKGFDNLLCECVESFIRDIPTVATSKQDNSINPDCFKFQRVR